MANPKIESKQAYKDELKRQTDIFVEAFQKSINAAAMELGRPVMSNAIASAITIMAGETLAIIPPGKDRNALRKAIVENLGNATAHARGRLGGSFVGAINMNGKDTVQ